MGLTLHYQLSAPSRSAAEVYSIIESLRHHAQSLSFQDVSGIIDLKGDDCLFDRTNRDDPHSWLKVQTIRFLTTEQDDVITAVGETHPIHIIAFTVHPGEGSEAGGRGQNRVPQVWANKGAHPDGTNLSSTRTDTARLYTTPRPVPNAGRELSSFQHSFASAVTRTAERETGTQYEFPFPRRTESQPATPHPPHPPIPPANCPRRNPPTNCPAPAKLPPSPPVAPSQAPITPRQKTPPPQPPL